MVLTKEQFMEAIKSRIGESTNDSDIKFLEDMTDTFTSLESSAGTDWKQKFEENDKQWREKYTSRFFAGDSEHEQKPQQQETQVPPVSTEVDLEVPAPEDVSLDDIFLNPGAQSTPGTILVGGVS